MIVSSSTTWLILTMPSSDLVVMVFSTLLNWVGSVCTATLFRRGCCLLLPAVESNEELLPTWQWVFVSAGDNLAFYAGKYLRRCWLSYFSSNHKCILICNFFNWNCSFSVHWLARIFRFTKLDSVFHCHFHQNLMIFIILAHQRRWMRKDEKQLSLYSLISQWNVSISYDESS